MIDKGEVGGLFLILSFNSYSYTTVLSFLDIFCLILIRLIPCSLVSINQNSWFLLIPLISRTLTLFTLLETNSVYSQGILLFTLQETLTLFTLQETNYIFSPEHFKLHLLSRKLHLLTLFTLQETLILQETNSIYSPEN